ncbi:hypothetical protein AAMO2058_000226000 [Amorphochlora amoebiformis]
MRFPRVSTPFQGLEKPPPPPSNDYVPPPIQPNHFFTYSRRDRASRENFRSRNRRRRWARAAWVAAVAVLTAFDARADSDWDYITNRGDGIDLTGANVNPTIDDVEDDLNQPTIHETFIYTKENGTGQDHTPPPEEESWGYLQTIFEDMGGTTMPQPWGVHVSPDNNVYFTDIARNQVRKISPEGGNYLVAGSKNGWEGRQDGRSSKSLFFGPRGISMDSKGNIYIADTANYIIRQITPDGKEVYDFAGSGLYGSKDGTMDEMRFLWPTDVAVDLNDTIYVCDPMDRSIRKIYWDDFFNVWMSDTVIGHKLLHGYEDGFGKIAKFQDVTNIAFSGFDNHLYSTSKMHDRRIRKIKPHSIMWEKSEIVTIAGTHDVIGYLDGPNLLALFSSVLKP